MILTRRLAAAAIVALVSLSPRAAWAQSWVLCTPGAFRSCHSVAIATTPQMSGSVRIGTNVTVTLANLQGTHPLDNAAWSGLKEVNIVGGPSTPQGGFGRFMTFALNGGATGLGTYQYFDGTGTTTSVGMFNATGTGLIGGCAAVPVTPATPLGGSFRTCGASASISFSTTTQAIFDASVFKYAIIDVDGPNGHVRCVSDPNFVSSRPLTVACEDHTDDVVATPEPVTIALLGTGLFGIGGAGLRRKRKNEAA